MHLSAAHLGMFGESKGWVKVGNSLSITNNWNTPGIAAMTSTRIAHINSSNQMQAYDYDGNNWNAIGTPFSFGVDMQFSVICPLTSTRVAVICTKSGWLRAYDFNGSTWSLVGSSYAMSTYTSFRYYAVKLDTAKILIGDLNTGSLRIYTFNGSAWSPLTGYVSSLGYFRGICRVSSSLIALMGNGDNFKIYNYTADGTSITLNKTLSLPYADIVYESFGVMDSIIDDDSFSIYDRTLGQIVTIKVSDGSYFITPDTTTAYIANFICLDKSTQKAFIMRASADTHILQYK